jgi:hypothetical protein
MKLQVAVVLLLLSASGCHSGHSETFPRLHFAYYADGKVSELMLYDSGEFSAWSEAMSSHTSGELDATQFAELQASFEADIVCNEDTLASDLRYQTDLLLPNGTRCEGRWSDLPAAPAITREALAKLTDTLHTVLME